MTLQRDALALLVDLSERMEWVEDEIEARGKKFGAMAAGLRRDVAKIQRWVEGDPMVGESGAAETLRRVARQVTRLEKTVSDPELSSQIERIDRDIRSLQERLGGSAQIDQLERNKWRRAEITKLLERAWTVAKMPVSIALLALALWMAARLGVLGEVLQQWAQHPLGGGG